MAVVVVDMGMGAVVVVADKVVRSAIHRLKCEWPMVGGSMQR